MMELFSAKLAWSDPVLGTRLLCTRYVFLAPVTGNIIIYTLDTVYFQDALLGFVCLLRFCLLCWFASLFHNFAPVHC